MELTESVADTEEEVEPLGLPLELMLTDAVAQEDTEPLMLPEEVEEVERVPLTEAEVEAEPLTEGQLLTDRELLRVPDTVPVTDTDTELELLTVPLVVWLAETLPEGVGDVEREPDTLPQLLAEELTE